MAEKANSSLWETLSTLKDRFLIFEDLYLFRAGNADWIMNKEHFNRHRNI